MASAVLKVKYYDYVYKKPRHYHHCHQILFVTGGSADFEINDSLYTVKEGSLIIFSKFEQHSVSIKEGDYRRYVLEIDPDILVNAGSRYGIVSVLFNRPAGFFNILDVSDCMDEFKSIFERMVTESESERVLSSDMLDILMQELLIMVCRRFPESFIEISENNFHIVSEMQNRFEKEYKENFTLEALSREYNLSVSYLSHLFKEVTGNSVMGYLLFCRIAAAKKLLAESKKSISEIVDECGFSDASNFSRTFKKLTGNSPSEFRKKYNQH
ncbi:MAG: helix-turn-helix transcriptional regulator [Clostridia bacterium]|nr:helix-turn-helix transcriptional regulator [Clostridia bacterium]